MNGPLSMRLMEGGEGKLERAGNKKGRDTFYKE